MVTITLEDFVRKNNAELGASFATLMKVIAQTAQTINDKLSYNGLIEEQGLTGGTNAYGEMVEKLDAYANDIFTSQLLESGVVRAVGSEELAEPKMSTGGGVYNVTHDPLDGSKNIDTNLPIGTIFGIYPSHDSLIQKGSSQIASGYILYGPSLMLVYATPGRVDGFTYNFKDGKYYLSHENIRIGNKKIYSINEGYWEVLFDQDKAYLESIKKDGSYSLRYVGSMVGDVHRTLLKGGIFLYPADKKHENGKLRLLYEAAPLGNLIIQAGGMAVSRGVNILDILPEKHDQRVPIILGSIEEVEKYLAFHK